MSEITIEEVYNKSTKDELGSEKSRVNTAQYGSGILIGRSDIGGYNGAISYLIRLDSANSFEAMSFSGDLLVMWPIEEEKEPKLYAPAVTQTYCGFWRRKKITQELYISLDEAKKDLECGEMGSNENTVVVLHWPYGEPQELNAHKF